MEKTLDTIQPLENFPLAERRNIRYVLMDIDDTLTWEGKLPAIAYSALEQLKASGITLIPVTGRPAGWCDHIARMWPVDAIVGENGAFYFRYEQAAKKMRRIFSQSEEERAKNRERLRQIGERILERVPGSAISADQLYRECDLAIDFCEDVHALDWDAVDKIVEIFKSYGAQAKVSSIHVNGWFGSHNKRTMVERLLKDDFAHDLDRNPDVVIFAGDSPNDAPLFAGLPNAVGVANIRSFLPQISTPPRWITQKPGGYGFAELAEALLAARKD